MRVSEERWSTMGVTTDGEEINTSPTVAESLELTEKACDFEQQVENKKSLLQDAHCDSRIQDQKLAEGTGVQPFYQLHNMQRRHMSDIPNTGHNEAKEQYRNVGDCALSATSQRPNSDLVDVEDDTSESMQGALVTPYTDTQVDLIEGISSPTPAEIMELLDTSGDDDWDAVYEALLEEMRFGDPDMLKQDLSINPDTDLLDEEGYTPLYKAVLKGRLEIVDDLISQGANPDKPSKGGLTPLHAAAQEGHEDIVDFFILQGADVNVECENGRTPLHTAAENGHTNIMDSLFAEGTDVSKKDNTGWTPFSAAIRGGHLEAVKLLISNGAKPNRYNGMTPLYLAAQSGHLHIVKFLISNGADVNKEEEVSQIYCNDAASEGCIIVEYLFQQFFMSIRYKVNEETDKGMIPLHGAAARGHMEIMEYLIEQGSDVNKSDVDGWTPFNAAVQYGHLEAVKYLMSNEVKQNKYRGMTPLYLAAQSGHLHIVKFFISNGADVNEENDSGMIPLHGAATKGHMKIMEYLIQKGSSVNKGDLKGLTPFIVAIHCGHLEAVKYLMSIGAKQNRYGGMTPLYLAAQSGHLHIVKFFISNGADVNEENDRGRIPLHGAATKGHMKVMEYLIQKGSKVNKGDDIGFTPFNAAVHYGNLEAVKYLTVNGAKQNRYEGMTPLYAASQCGRLELVKFFISEGADVNEEHDDGMIPLHGAAAGGHMKVMEYLIQQGSDVNKGGPRGWTPLNAAVQYGHLEAVNYLMVNGVKQNRYDGKIPLYLAAQSGHLNIVKFFISEGADVNEKNDKGMIPLNGAATKGHMKVMEYLIQKGSNVNKGDSMGWTPFNAAVRNGQLEAVKYLMDKGAKQNRYDGMTPLYLAAQSGHLNMVKFFISEGRDVNEVNDSGMTPLHGAAESGHLQVLEYLVQKGSDVTKKDHNGWAPLLAAVRNGQLEAVKFLMANGAQVTRINGMTPLYIASQHDHIAVVKCLVSKKYDVNERSECGKSPLHAACYNGNLHIVKYLVDHKANVNEQDSEGWTPLHAAAQEGHRDIVEFLAENGADITARDIEGMTTLQAAAKGDHTNVMKYLTLLGGGTLTEDTNDPRYRSSQGDARRHHTSSKFEGPVEDEDMYGSGGMDYNSPGKRFAPEQSSDAATTDSGDGYSLADADENDITAVHDEYIPTMPPHVEKWDNDECNPFVNARLKCPEKTATTAEQKHVGGSKGSQPEERRSSADQDHERNIFPAQYDSLTHGLPGNTDHNAFSLLNGSPMWKHGGFDQSSQHTSETNCHPHEETEPRCHTTLGEPISSMNARKGQRTTENEEKFKRPIRINPPADEDHRNSNEANSFAAKRYSSQSGWKTKKKRRSVDRPRSSFLVLVRSLIHMIIALAILLAGSPVLVAGSATTDKVTLRAGKNSVIPFNLTWPSVGTSHVDPYFTLRFESKSRPFCINGHLDVDGFKSPSQISRFTTSVEELAASFFMNLLIETVDSLDEDMYVLTVIRDDFQDIFREIVMKEILVEIPPGPANCFIGLSDDNDNPYEVHCHATSGSVTTTLSCYQKRQKIYVKGEITDNGQVTRGVFFLPDNSHFSCCSHDVDSIVTATICNDFEWPPSRKITTQGTSPSYSSRPINKHNGTTQISEEETPTTSGACRQSMYRFVLWMMVLLIYLFALVVL